MPNFQGGKKKDLARSWAFCDHKRQDAIGRVQINVNGNYSHPNSPFAQTRILETFFLVLDKSWQIHMFERAAYGCFDCAFTHLEQIGWGTSLAYASSF